jgi:hypothetical protein
MILLVSCGVTAWTRESCGNGADVGRRLMPPVSAATIRRRYASRGVNDPGSARGEWPYARSNGSFTPRLAVSDCRCPYVAIRRKEHAARCTRFVHQRRAIFPGQTGQECVAVVSSFRVRNCDITIDAGCALGSRHGQPRNVYSLHDALLSQNATRRPSRL